MLVVFFFFSPPPPPPSSTLFPYTTLFRSPSREMIMGSAPAAPPWDVRHPPPLAGRASRSEEHTSELQSLRHLVCRLLLEKKKSKRATADTPTASTRSSTACTWQSAQQRAS